MKPALVAMVLVLAAGIAAAAAPQPLDALQASAVAAVRAAAPEGTRLVAEAGRLDPRLQLAACRGALQATAPDFGRATARVSVPVACRDQGWSVRVPVHVQMFRKVLVAGHALARGDVIGAGDVRVEERDTARLGYGYLVDPAQLIGRSLRRPLLADTVIAPGMLAAREVVERGQQVRVVAAAAGIRVRAEGIALDAGDTGALVRVKRPGCRCIVQGRVVGAGVVEVLP